MCDETKKMNFEAIGENVIVVLRKEKDKSNGEYQLENGLIAVGTNVDEQKGNNEFDKFIGTVISVGGDVNEVEEGDVVRTKQFVGDILSDEDTESELIRTILFNVKDILAKVI